MVPRFSTRRRVLALVFALIFISLLSSALNLYRTSEVSRLINGMNTVSVPLGRHLVQMQVDSEVFLREIEKGLGQSHWKDSHWTPRLAPKWILEVVQKESDRVFEFLRMKSEWTDEESKSRWIHWAEELSRSLHIVVSKSFALYSSLEKKDFEGASEIYPEWSSSLGSWKRTLQTGAADYEQSLRKSFQLANSKTDDLKDGLEIILLIVVLLSLSLLWLSERALRPLEYLTQLARDITRRGLRKEDKSQVPILSLNRTDEVSQLAREFHNMATSLLEREKTVESQNDRLTVQNRQLREMGALQERLRAAENLAAIGRMSAQVAHEVRNPLHSIGLEAEIALDLCAKQNNINLKQSVQSILNSVDRLEKITENYLKLSRLSSGKKRQVDIGEILESVLATYTSMCESQKVKVEWHRLPNSNLKVYGDPDLLEQALGNLLRNALQALQTEGRIEWTLGQMESGKVWIKIQDNGPGIPLEIRSRLFTPFVTTKAQGTGLGLSFIKQVMDDHSSTVRCVDVDQGACFEILMPSADSMEIQPEKSPEVDSHA
jgi:signal transduction histidine kinase